MEKLTSWVGYNQNKLTQFKTEAFKFISSNAIEVECIVKICFTYDYSPSCTFCNENSGFRARRKVISESSLNYEKVVVVKSSLFYVAKNGKTDIRLFVTKVYKY